MALISGRMTYFSFYVTTFSNGPLLGVPSYSVGGGVTCDAPNPGGHLCIFIIKF